MEWIKEPKQNYMYDKSEQPDVPCGKILGGLGLCFTAGLCGRLCFIYSD